MPLTKLEINGLRGFATKQTIDFAMPNGEPGSGLTILVGPNNGGKSTVIEAIRAVSLTKPPSFTVGKRNQKAGDRIQIRAFDENGNKFEVRTVGYGGSECRFSNSNSASQLNDIFLLPSRRYFNPSFGKNSNNRQQYTTSSLLPATRSATISGFSARLFNILSNRDKFNEVLKKVLDPVPNWTIDQDDSGHYFLKYDIEDSYHNSDGLGDGIISLLFIIDALYDSVERQVIVIDEPELSLHPSLQRKLSELIIEYSKDRQIIIATHSPYFLDFNAIINGAQIARVYSQNYESQISVLSKKSQNKIRGLLENLNNPHILGFDAKETFFLDDEIILVEGQEDVVFYREILNQLNISIKGNFFGWGVGGAGNMNVVAGILKDLGFQKVAGILDSDKSDDMDRLSKEFPEYSFNIIPTQDVRDKPDREVEGLVTRGGELKVEYHEYARKLFEGINTYFVADS